MGLPRIWFRWCPTCDAFLKTSEKRFTHRTLNRPEDNSLTGEHCQGGNLKLRMNSSKHLRDTRFLSRTSRLVDCHRVMSQDSSSQLTGPPNRGNIRTYFWAYDIFGYLIPGFVVTAGFSKGNKWVYESFVQQWSTDSLQSIILIIGASYVVGHVVAGVSSWLLERLIFRKCIGYPTEWMFPEVGESREHGRIRAFLFRGYFRPYSDDFREAVKQRLKHEYGIGIDSKHDLFWLAWTHVCKSHPVGYRRATHFLELYGLSRNVSMSFILLSLSPLLGGWTGFVDYRVWTPLCLFSALVMYATYVKLIRRMNDEVYRSFLVSA